MTALSWSLVVMLVLAGVLNYVDRQALAALGPTIKAEFHLSSTDWGWINSSFALVYIVSSVLGGMWIDKVGVRNGLLISTLVWSLAAAGHAFAHDFWSLCFWRMMLAIGEGPGNASLLKGMRRLMTPKLRDTGTSMISAGWAAGSLLAPIFAGLIAETYGWQGALMATGGLSLLWIPLWIALACPCWGIDNNLSQRLSLRNPLQISAAKALGAAVPMLAVAHLQGHAIPFAWMSAVLLGIGSLGYGVSIWLDIVALASLGAAREAVVFSTAPFLGALVAVALLGSPLSPSLLLAAAAMALSTGLLLRSSHGHWHRHAELDHQHRHFHAPVNGDAHHIHSHRPEDLADLEPDQPFWHSHRHRHDPLAHEHPHVSDVHHRHQH